MTTSPALRASTADVIPLSGRRRTSRAAQAIAEASARREAARQAHRAAEEAN